MIPEIVPKLWGCEKILVNNPKYCMKLLYLNSGFESSLHKHQIKDETFLCIDGKVQIEWMIDESSIQNHRLLNGSHRDFIRIPPSTIHRFQAIDGPAIIVEASTHHSDSDVIRLEPSRMVIL